MQVRYKFQLLKAGTDWTGVVLRVSLAVVLFPHGAQKLLGWFGGPGFETSLQLLTGPGQLPLPVALLVVGTEFFGALGLLLGAGSRLWAAVILLLMVGVAFTPAAQNGGFFMNWFGLSLAVVLNGSGRYSLDAQFTRR